MPSNIPIHVWIGEEQVNPNDEDARSWRVGVDVIDSPQSALGGVVEVSSTGETEVSSIFRDGLSLDSETAKRLLLGLFRGLSHQIHNLDGNQLEYWTADAAVWFSKFLTYADASRVTRKMQGFVVNPPVFESTVIVSS